MVSSSADASICKNSRVSMTGFVRSYAVVINRTCEQLLRHVRERLYVVNSTPMLPNVVGVPPTSDRGAVSINRRASPCPPAACNFASPSRPTKRTCRYQFTMRRCHRYAPHSAPLCSSASSSLNVRQIEESVFHQKITANKHNIIENTTTAS